MFYRGDIGSKVIIKFIFQNHFGGLNYDYECVGSFTKYPNRNSLNNNCRFNTTKAFGFLTLQKLYQYR
jgi:hypothetical protein